MHIFSRVAVGCLGVLSLTRVTLSQTGPVANNWDYIVIGAGPTGLVAADRLSQAGHKTLLIERGPPSTAETGGWDVPPSPWPPTTLTRFDVPGLFESMFSGPENFWWCKDVNVFAGCLIGGGSSVNAALYWVPPDVDWGTQNRWPATGWDANTMNPYVAKVLARLPSTDTPSPDGIRYLTQVYNVTSKLLSGQGYGAATINTNPNWKDHVYGYPAYDFQGGKRAGAVATYFRTSKARSNFKYLQYTNVLNIVRNGAQITGVTTNDTSLGNNGTISIQPKGRVILAAGALQSPRLLFNSGIGPADQITLAANNAIVGPGVPPNTSWINIPAVGYNVSDNPSINFVFSHPSVDSYDNWGDLWDDPRLPDATRYVHNQTGVFAGASPKINFWRAYDSLDGKTRYLQGTGRPGASGVVSAYPYNSSTIFTITSYLSHGITSRGRVGIDSTNRVKILTNPWFEDPIDKAVMMNGLTDLISNMNTVPGLTLVMPDNTTTLATYVNQYDPASMNSNHWCGSTRIGADDGRKPGGWAVVDLNTKVYGTNNLFIVDAGIVPGQPMSNPHLMFMAVAEAATAKILALTGGP